MEPVRTGVLGCGAVSRQYLPVLTQVSNLDVVAVADVDAARADEVGAKFGVMERVAPDEMIRGSQVELVVNLTPITAHFQTTTAALLSGKHVYSEKTLAVTTTETRQLLSLAAERNLVLACAPDTLLGTGFSAARSAIDGGDIGRPLSAVGAMLRAPLKGFPALPGGAFPLYDMAPYYLTAMVELFGPARQVVGAFQDGSAREDDGDVFASAASVEFSAVVAQLSLVWGTTYRREVPFVAVFGTDGEVRLPNPNAFDGPVKLRKYAAARWDEVDGSRQAPGLPSNLRGLGVSDMARAIRDGRPPRADAAVAAHVVELIEAIVASAGSGRRVQLATSCARPAPLADDERSELLAGLLEKTKRG